MNENQIAVRTMDDLSRVGNVISKSRMFGPHSESLVAQACVKVLAGQEYGFGPFASMKAIHIIDGTPQLSGNALAGLVQKSTEYDYRVRVLTDDECTIAFFNSAGDELGESTFTIEDAKQAGAKFQSRSGEDMPWAKFPRNMLFARAISNGVRWFCPAVTLGGAVYTENEFENGEVDTITVMPALEQDKPGLDDEVQLQEVEIVEVSAA